MTKLPSRAKLQKAWEDLQEIHREYLEAHGVKIPRAKKYTDKAKSVWLAYLFLNSDRDVDKNEISSVVRRDMPGRAPDQQVRHLKRDGWDIGAKPGVHRLNPYKPSLDLLTSDVRRRATLNSRDFNDLRKTYGYRCATCGAREGRPDPRYGEAKVALQRGRMDPRKRGDKTKNVIPQCQFCNRAYKSDYVFDEKGRVRAVASVQPVKRASASVQKEILDWLVSQLDS